MGLSQTELSKVQNVTHEEAYNRIKCYYSDFIKGYNKLNDAEKKEHIFGNGRSCSPNYVNNSTDYISALPKDPKLAESIDLAKNVLCGKLEYAYHDQDKNSVKIAAYAHYIINSFNNGEI